MKMSFLILISSFSHVSANHEYLIMAGAWDMQGIGRQKMAGQWSRPGGAMKTPYGFCGFPSTPLKIAGCADLTPPMRYI
jgi:hypothetical protein